MESGSNIWRRGDGTGLVRLLSSTDLAGLDFTTEGMTWTLSQRRSGLYVASLTAAEVTAIVPPFASAQQDGGRAPTVAECLAALAQDPVGQGRRCSAVMSTPSICRPGAGI